MWYLDIYTPGIFSVGHLYSYEQIQIRIFTPANTTSFTLTPNLPSEKARGKYMSSVVSRPGLSDAGS